MNFECIYSGFNQRTQQERSIIGGLCNLFTLGIINTDGALSGVYVCYTNRSLWNWSFCYDVFDLEARSSLVLLVYLLEDIAWKNHLQDHCFPLMSYWRFRGIVYRIPQFPSVCADFHQGNKKKLTRHLDFDRLNFFVTSYISWWFFFYCSSLCGNVFFLPLASSGSDDDKKCVPIIKPISLWCRKGCKKFNLVIYL